jgi:hypothetical protein
MIINNRTDLDSLPKDEQAKFKARLTAGINSWQWVDGDWVLTQNTETLERFNFTLADFPDAPVPDKPETNPDEQEQERKAQEIIENRRQAYLVESDPILFRALRDEATMEEWKEKVQEIKDRFPKSDSK